MLHKRLFIAAEVRSGSTALGELLAYNYQKAFGNEWFGLLQEPFTSFGDNSDADEIFSAVSSLWTDKDGWASAKIMCPTLSVFNRECLSSDSLNSLIFGENTFWVIVQRRDKIAQAVSLAFAKKYNDWHLYEELADFEDQYTVTNLEVERDLKELILSNIFLEEFLTKVEPSRRVFVEYCDLKNEPQKVLRLVGEMCGFKAMDNDQLFSSEIEMPRLVKDLPDQKQQCRNIYSEWFLRNHHFVDLGRDGALSYGNEIPEFVSSDEVYYEVLRLVTVARERGLLSELSYILKDVIEEK